MSKRRRLAIYLLSLGLFTGLFWYCLRPGEPVYQGKRLTSWLKDLAAAKAPIHNDPTEAAAAIRLSQGAKAREAVLRIGTNALPHLLRFLRSSRPESKFRTFVEGLLEKQKYIRVELPVAEDLSWLAVEGFEVIGPAGKPAIPELAGLLGNDFTGPQAAECLRRIGVEAVPALAGALASKNPSARYLAINLLGDFGEAARGTIPLLIEVCRSPTNPGAGAAMRVLSEIHDSPTTFLALFVRRLNETNLATDAAFALAGVGPNGVPPLVDGLTHPDTRIQSASLAALLPRARGLGRSRGAENPSYHFSNASGSFGMQVNRLKAALEAKRAAPLLALALGNVLDCTNTVVRLKAVQVLAGCRVDAVAALSKAAGDPDPKVSEAATNAIGALGLGVREGAVIRGPRDRRRLALVFTGHDFAEAGDTILNELASHKSKATFFLTGDFLRNKAFTGLVERMSKEGHQLGPHSDKHLLYCSWDRERKMLVSRKEFEDDLTGNYNELQQKASSPFFRYLLPPYEHYNQQIADWAHAFRLILINFTPGTRSTADYTGEADANFVSTGNIFQSIVRKDQEDPDGLKGFLLLLHLGAGPGRADKFHSRFGELLDYLAEKGYDLVTVDELLRPAAP